MWPLAHELADQRRGAAGAVHRLGGVRARTASGSRAPASARRSRPARRVSAGRRTRWRSRADGGRRSSSRRSQPRPPSRSGARAGRGTLRAVTPSRTSCTTSAPAASAAAPFASSSSAGISPSPIRARPRQSSATAIVLAVKWPAHVPEPGHATRSSSSSSSRAIRPRSSAPIASQTSPIVTGSAVTAAGAHRPAVEDDGRLVDASERHQRGRRRLVAADQADEPVEVVGVHHQLDRVGDHLARDERGAHPRRSLRLVVGDRDRVELERDATRPPRRRRRPGARARAD